MAGSAALFLINPNTGAQGLPVAAGTDDNWLGGVAVFAAAGTFGGATVTLQMLGPDGVTWLACGANTTLTAPGVGVAYLPPCRVRAVVTGGTPSGLYASLARVIA